MYFALSCWVLSCLSGCNSHPDTYPVQGKVLFPSGAAVRTGTVEAKSRQHGLNARGEIQPDGSFTLSTFRPGDGAVAGIHDCVVVQFVVAEQLGTVGSAFGVVDPKHNSYKTSGLMIDIQPDTINQVVLQVSALGGKELKEKDHRH
ncbi:MAG: hypothetical protein KF752_00545 [Pirellulaceae bacterium]|nr:hypothetical protein [Pirellulaceae bacterium]